MSCPTSDFLLNKCSSIYIILNVYKYILFYIGDRVLPPAARLGRDPRDERLQGGLLLRKPRFRGGHEDRSTQEEQGGEEKQKKNAVEYVPISLRPM